jgi:hypothetical protein
MDLAVKSGGSVLYDAETPKEITITSQDLHNQQLRLQEELREMMNEGNMEGILRVRNLLRDLPDRIVAAEVAEIKKGIEDCTKRLAEIKEEAEYARSVLADKNRILLEKLKVAERAGDEVVRVEFVLFQLNNEEQIMHGARREHKTRLQNLMEDAEQSMEVN